MNKEVKELLKSGSQRSLVRLRAIQADCPHCNSWRCSNCGLYKDASRDPGNSVNSINELKTNMEIQKKQYEREIRTLKKFLNVYEEIMEKYSIPLDTQLLKRFKIYDHAFHESTFEELCEQSELSEVSHFDQ